MKEKWANAYHPVLFTAETHTNSRAESLNSAIKKYLDSRSEVCAIMNLIENLEARYFFNESLLKDSPMKALQEPILQSIENKLGKLIYTKHVHQFSTHGLYKILPPKEKEQSTVYQVTLDKPNQEESKEGFTVVWSEDNAECSCQLELTEGIICRHVFAVAKMRVVKDSRNTYIRDGDWTITKIKQ